MELALHQVRWRDLVAHGGAEPQAAIPDDPNIAITGLLLDLAFLAGDERRAFG